MRLISDTRKPDTMAMVAKMKVKTTAYFPKSCISSRSSRLRRGFLTFLVFFSFLVFFISPPPRLPIEIGGGDFLLVHIIPAHLTVAQLDDLIRHILDCVVVGDNDDGVAVLFVELFQQLQQLL